MTLILIAGGARVTLRPYRAQLKVDGSSPSGFFHQEGTKPQYIGTSSLPADAARAPTAAEVQPHPSRDSVESPPMVPLSPFAGCKRKSRCPAEIFLVRRKSCGFPPELRSRVRLSASGQD
jgi:hypothetical protein